MDDAEREEHRMAAQPGDTVHTVAAREHGTQTAAF